MDGEEDVVRLLWILRIIDWDQVPLEHSSCMRMSVFLIGDRTVTSGDYLKASPGGARVISKEKAEVSEARVYDENTFFPEGPGTRIQ